MGLSNAVALALVLPLLLEILNEKCLSLSEGGGLIARVVPCHKATKVTWYCWVARIGPLKSGKSLEESCQPSSGACSSPGITNDLQAAVTSPIEEIHTFRE